MASPKIKIDRLSKAFGTKAVLTHIELEVARGESLVILGRSGSGKSVLLKLILGLLDPDDGRIEVDGVPLVYTDQRVDMRSQIGMLFQNAALFDSMNVWRNVAFGLMHVQRVAPKEAYHRALAVLESVGLGERDAHLMPIELSGGMRKRVGLARAVVGNPEILFFDEPTTGLDPVMSAVINQLIHDKVKQLGSTAITITHDMGSMAQIADQVMMLRDTRVGWHGPVSQVETSPDPDLQQFLAYGGAA